ncbi:RpiB/LacA/LacB family sugar-phosphate isomerase [Bdellovibrio sp. HCB274]|uniref:RpiB/LacA/LacB family sugar-phosphate isomerase n=1 Tax=Bdellovibrio sp. HCB274 TaxID=3394361 RepID=UPI0039B5366A
MIIYIGSDHAGLDLKVKVMAALQNVEWQDQGTLTADSVDYPDYADKVCKEMTKVEILNQKSGTVDPIDGPAIGILVCGSGQGMAIRANRYPQIRAALCWNEDIARLSREHNNANILVLSARFTAPDLAIKMVQEFLKTKFQGGRHKTRVDKLATDTGC